MAKRKQAQHSGRSQAPATRRDRSPGCVTLALFWPFFFLHWLLRGRAGPFTLLLRLVGYPAMALLCLLIPIAAFYGLRAQTYDLTRIHAMPERSILYDRQGEEIGRIHGEKRSIVPLSQIGEDFRLAILAREDERFYLHPAVDPVGIVRAIVKNLQGKREGASTITQQLASDVFRLKAGEQRGDILRQLDRKCLEIAIAFRLESWLSKDEILEAYINQINWGRQIKGVGEAARIYFEKHPSQLSLSESALLAGIVRGPDAYNPFRSLDAARRERDTTLDRMVRAKAIPAERAAAAKEEPIEVRPEWRRDAHESYAMDALRRDLEIILEKENIELGGCEIFTTIDLRLQRVAEEAIDRRLREVERRAGYPHQTQAGWRALPAEGRSAPAYLQGATVLLENRTGAVLAVVGGRNADESAFNRATHAKRQVGSIFKPFVYLAAFDQGLRPDTRISDGPIQPGEIRGGGSWRPKNSDGTYGGMEPASTGLIRSRNTMSVRVGNYAGLARVKQVASAVGFATPMPEKPASLLGTWEASPWEVATAYSIFPNDGERYRPYLIAEIKDREGNILYSCDPLSYSAASSGSAWSVSRILQEVATRGTAASVGRLGFDKPVAGKTGTTNDFKDAWFAGYTSSLSCAVWVGFDQPKRTIQGGYGSVLSLPIWVDIMKTADRLGYKAGALHTKVNLVPCRLCRLSGKRATAGCEANESAYDDLVPADIAVAENDLCPIHPARALAVGENETPPPSSPPRAQPIEEIPPAARPVEPSPTLPPPPPPRAVPVPPARAVPVEEEAPRAIPIR
jgi:penicillin-binding protein 1A